MITSENSFYIFVIKNFAQIVEMIDIWEVPYDVFYKKIIPNYFIPNCSNQEHIPTTEIQILKNIDCISLSIPTFSTTFMSKVYNIVVVFFRMMIDLRSRRKYLRSIKTKNPLLTYNSMLCTSIWDLVHLVAFIRFDTKKSIFGL